MTKELFTGKMPDVYGGKDSQSAQKNYWARASFCAMWRKLPLEVQERIFWPNRVASPWYLRAEIHGQGVNIWPHKKTWQRDRQKKQQAEEFWLDLQQHLHKLYRDERVTQERLS